MRDLAQDLESWPTAAATPGSALRDVTDAERDLYRRDGAVRLPKILPGPWVERLRACTEEWRSRPGDFAIAWTDPGHARSTAGGINVVHSRLARQCVFGSPAARIAAQTHCADELRYFEDQIFSASPAP